MKAKKQNKNKVNKMSENYQDVYFKEIPAILEQYGILTFVLPFLIIFSLVFLILEVTNLFKTDDKDIEGRKVHVLLSIGFALTALGNKNVITWMAVLIPQATIWLLAIFLLLLAIGLILRGDPDKMKIHAWFRWALALIVTTSIIVIAASALIRRPGLSMYLIDYSLLSSFSAVIIVFAIILAIAVWLTSEGSEVSEAKQEEKK